MKKEPAKKSTVYFQITPGLESWVEKELELRLQEVSPDLTTRITATLGGIECELPFEVASWLIPRMKTPQRALLRLAHFKATDFPTLFRKLQAVPWSHFLRMGKLSLKVSSRASRLKIIDRIKDVTLKAIEQSNTHQPLRKEFLDVEQLIHINLRDDQVQVSMDLSGKALYQRGYKTIQVRAPLRENLAAIAYMMAKSAAASEPINIVDPFCGSGTLLIESVLFDHANTQRTYAFQNFPRIAGPISAKVPPVQKTKKPSTPFGVVGIDVNLPLIKVLQPHLAALLKGVPVRTIGSAFQDQSDISLKGAWVLSNPPFGRRLEKQTALIADFKKWLQVTTPDLVGLVLPENSEFDSLPDYAVQLRTRFSFQGLACQMWVATNKKKSIRNS